MDFKNRPVQYSPLATSRIDVKRLGIQAKDFRESQASLGNHYNLHSLLRLAVVSGVSPRNPGPGFIGKKARPG